MTPAEDLAVVRTRLERMIEMANAATSGPWRVDESQWRAPTWPDDCHYLRIVAGDPNSVSGIYKPVVSTDGATDGTSQARVRDADAVFIAAASPDLLLRLAREALGVLDRHAARGPWPYATCRECPSEFWPDCPDAAAVLRAWQP